MLFGSQVQPASELYESSFGLHDPFAAYVRQMCDRRKRDAIASLQPATAALSRLHRFRESGRNGSASTRDNSALGNHFGCDMDDLYAINFAKTEFREAFNTSDPERLITLLDPEFVYMPDGLGQTMGADAADTIRMQFRGLTERYYVQLHPIIIEIRIQGSVAFEYGWHIWKKTPRDGSSQINERNRYLDIWRKNEKGEWKLWMYMNNADSPMQAPTAA